MRKPLNLKLTIKNSKLLFLCGVLFWSCTLGPGNFSSSHSTDLQTRTVRRIAVLPPESVTAGARAQAPAGPSSAPDKGGKREPAALLSDLIYSVVAALPRWQIVSDREVREVLTMVPGGAQISRVKRLGELVYADAVFSARIVRFRERVGEEWGARSPASVAFVVDLWDVKRGDIMWSGQFDETQKPLSENIFALGEFTQRGGRWLTAEELTHEGVKKAMSQLHQILYPRAAS